MSVSPTDDALIVALDFEGESNSPHPSPFGTHLRMDIRQAYTASSVLLRRTRFLFFSILPFPIS